MGAINLLSNGESENHKPSVYAGLRTLISTFSLFPLESQNVFFSDFIRFLCGFCPDNPANAYIFDSPRDFCSQCVASCFLCSFSSSQPYYSICTTIPNYKALLNKLRGWRMERQPLFKSVISSRPFPALRWAYSSRFAALLAVCQT